MARDTTFDHLKGQGSGAAMAIIVVIIAVVVVLIAFPGVLSGIGLNFGGGGAAPIGVGPGTAGVVISSFVASPATIESGDVVDFTMTVQNKGGINAKNIQYSIFGLDDSNSWSGKSVTQNGASNLGFEDTARNIPGETTVQEWESTSANKNTDITYPVTSRVDYQYSTESDLLVTLYGRNNVNVKNTGITSSTIGQISTSAGPLTVVPEGTIPLVGTSSQSFRVTFVVSNVGGGRTYVGDKATGLDKITVTAQGCTLSNTGDIKLINKQKTISCSVSPSIDSTGQETKTIKLTIDYNYIVESTANVRVLKQATQS